VRIRLSSIEAGDVSDELIKKILESDKICHHLHIPIQSGDDAILKKMNRRYSRSDYLKLIKRIQLNIPDIAITTDVLVGFPGETELNFNNTIDLLKKINPLKVHAFPYSLREGTSASELNQKVGQQIIKKRLDSLKVVSNECSVHFHKLFLNKKLSLLIEDKCKDDPD
jgi:tRNA A37 methylthiotransferase MiaB